MSILVTATNIILHILQKFHAKNITISDPRNNVEVLQKVQYIDGSTTDDLKLMEHPIEDGTMITDHIVDDPKGCNIKIKIDDDDSSSLSELLNIYKKRRKLTIKIKNEVYTNMYMSSKPLSVDAEHFNSTIYNLTFKEVQIAQTTYVKMKVPQVKNPKNASTVKIGQKQPQRSVLAGIKKRVGL